MHPSCASHKGLCFLPPGTNLAAGLAWCPRAHIQAEQKCTHRAQNGERVSQTKQ